MQTSRNRLPQLDGGLFLTDGGIETTLIFREGLELPDFAAFHLLATTRGEMALRKYFEAYVRLAERYRTGFVLESPTWRASRDWGQRLGYDPKALDEANRHAIALLQPLRQRLAAQDLPAVVSGCVGPRGDGYVPAHAMSVDEALSYHMAQIAVFSAGAADMVAAITMNYAEEASGIALAAKASGMPVAISFTVETDGRLPTGQPLGEAIAQVDAQSGGYPSYYMLNCAHPEHFDLVLQSPWRERIRGLRANASRKSHAELNESTELDSGDPAELGDLYADLKGTSLKNLNVVGGCCGTDERHVEAIIAKMGSEQFTGNVLEASYR